MKIAVQIQAGTPAKEIMEKFGVHKATAYRALKKGYLIPGYHEPTQCLGNPEQFDAENAQRIAEAVFWKKFSFIEEALGHKDDCIQEALLRMIEVQGVSSERNFFYGVAINAMRSYLQKQGILKKKYFFESLEEENN